MAVDAQMLKHQAIDIHNVDCYVTPVLWEMITCGVDSQIVHLGPQIKFEEKYGNIITGVTVKWKKGYTSRDVAGEHPGGAAPPGNLPAPPGNFAQHTFLASLPQIY